MERGQEQRRRSDGTQVQCRTNMQIEQKLEKEDGRWEKKEGEQRKRWRIMRK